MIPVLEYSRAGKENFADFSRELGKACRETGFFLLKNHGIEASLIAQVFTSAQEFFALPLERKQACSIEHSDANRGYVREGSESLDDRSGMVDAKEAFNIGLDLSPDDPRILRREPFRALNQWPELEDFREVTLSYFEAVWLLSVDLHRAIARDLGIEDDHFSSSFDAPMATLRLLHYPRKRPETSVGAGAHTDYGSITLLLTDGTAGLQVKPRGRDWIDVPHIDGAFVVNIGDLLMRWTNDTYVSTPHRVIAPQRERYSVAFFQDPNPGTLVTALPGTGEAIYPPVRAADYLRQRLDATYSKGH